MKGEYLWEEDDHQIYNFRKTRPKRWFEKQLQSQVPWAEKVKVEFHSKKIESFENSFNGQFYDDAPSNEILNDSILCSSSKWIRSFTIAAYDTWLPSFSQPTLHPNIIESKEIQKQTSVSEHYLHEPQFNIRTN